ncbi:MAG TPA: ABC transporter substrate-binding protein [Solirubrobacterales bacterium]|nr:ABC transporter substrate-binding protein [Solirubrobacterales bacterium]
MRAELRRLPAALVLLAVAALVAAGCGGGGQAPFKVGVVADCVGVNRSLHDEELAGAELPLIQRGAELRGQLPSGGVGQAEVGGRAVELVPGCTELWEFSILTSEVRRLVEREHVDAIVAAGSGPDEVVLAEVARLYPDVVFIAVAHGPRELTLRHRPANLFRFAADHGQGVAGLATYAYRRLGWRDAAVVLINWDAGWGARDAFVAEFCSLGGRISKQIPIESFDPSGRDVARIPRGADGVAVFAPPFIDPTGFLRRLASGYADPAGHILLGPTITSDPTLLRSVRGALTGVTGSSYVDPARMRGYLRAFGRAFPGTPADVAGDELVTGYHDSVAALLSGLEKAHGSTAALPAALAHLRVDLLGGPVHLDRNGQAVVSPSLVRIEPGDAPAPGLAREGTVRGVDQSIGGLLEPSMVPTDRPAKCKAGASPPPWARSPSRP